MPKLIPHKIKISASGTADRNQPDHFVQGYTPVNDQVGLIFAHAVIHLLVDQSEDNGLVSYHGLIVALDITHHLLLRAMGRSFVK